MAEYNTSDIVNVAKNTVSKWEKPGGTTGMIVLGVGSIEVAVEVYGHQAVSLRCIAQPYVALIACECVFIALHVDRQFAYFASSSLFMTTSDRVHSTDIGNLAWTIAIRATINMWCWDVFVHSTISNNTHHGTAKNWV